MALPRAARQRASRVNWQRTRGLGHCLVGEGGMLVVVSWHLLEAGGKVLTSASTCFISGWWASHSGGLWEAGGWRALRRWKLRLDDSAARQLARLCLIL